LALWLSSSWIAWLATELHGTLSCGTQMSYPTKSCCWRNQNSNWSRICLPSRDLTHFSLSRSYWGEKCVTNLYHKGKFIFDGIFFVKKNTKHSLFQFKRKIWILWKMEQILTFWKAFAFKLCVLKRAFHLF